ncbi:MAG: T9SS type A sorting domain-containing protein [Bacteroidota bacterium]
MKNIKKVVYMSLFTLSLLFAKNSTAQQISNHYFGVNAWMPDTIGNAKACTDPPCILNGKLHKQWGNIKNSNASIVRFGGIAPDKNMPTNYQYIRMIDSIRANGMEPIMQVPFHDHRYTALQAADIVRYINITKGRNIKYWIIGNEPNLGYGYKTSAQVARYFKPFASAMKTVDPSILTVGPECAWFDEGIMNGLTTPNGPDDITGRDAAGRFYLDVITFHTYPFSGGQSRADVISKLTAPGSFQDDLVNLNNRLNICNAAHGRSGSSKIKTAITEANIAYQNSEENLSGLGTSSFIGGQFVAEMLGLGMKHGVDFINIWSVIEGNGLGYLDGSGNKKPSYYHFKMLAENFKGNYVAGITNKQNVKSFASQNGQRINVMIMNQDQANFNYTVGLNATAIKGTNPLKINISANITNEYSDAIPAQSSVLLTFNSSGVIVKKTEYSLNGHAAANKAPTVTQYIVTDIADENIQNKFDLGISVFPNPTEGKFTIKLNEANVEERNIEINLVNIIGQEVLNKKSTFLNSKQEIELDPSIASGVYIVRVKEGTQVVTEKIVLEK